jgi:hypothetical protein
MKNLKTIGFLALVIVILFLVLVNGCQRRQLTKKVEEITIINTENELLKTGKKAIQDSLKNEIKKREALQTASIVIIKERDKLASENRLLRKQIADVPEWVNDLPIDSSYDYVNKIAYPFPGEQKYPFNEDQVKGIHSGFLQNIKLISLTDLQEKQIQNYQLQVDIANKLAKSYGNSLTLCMQQKGLDSTMIKNLTDKSDLLTKDNKKLTRRRNFWRTSSFIELGAIIILSIK